MIRAPKFLLIFAMIASAASLDLSAWKYRKRIALTLGDGFAVVKLDREIFIGARNTLADVRIVRDGEEIPSVIHYDAVGNLTLPSLKIVDKGIVEGKGVQFTLIASGAHDRVFIATKKHNFWQTVVIEASQDNKHWATLRSDGLIFDASQDGRAFRVMDVPYPVSTRRFLRVTVLGWMDLDAVESAGLDLASPLALDVMEMLSSITPVVTEDAATQSTLLTVDQGVSGLPIDQLHITSTTPAFHRAVTVEVSDDGKLWSSPAHGLFVRRVHNSGFSEESLTVPLFLDSGSRYQRVRVYNRDDQPLQFGPVQCEGRVRLIKFRAPASGNYWLYYGNPGAVTQPVYDLGKTLSWQEQLAKTAVPLGPAELNPAYRPPLPPRKPWSEQHPAILYTVLGGAVLALGIATFRFAVRLR